MRGSVPCRPSRIHRARDRRSMWMLWMLARALDLGWRSAVNAGKLPDVPHGDTLTFLLASAVVMCVCRCARACEEQTVNQPRHGTGTRGICTRPACHPATTRGSPRAAGSTSALSRACAKLSLAARPTWPRGAGERPQPMPRLFTHAWGWRLACSARATRSGHGRSPHARPRLSRPRAATTSCHPSA